MELTFKDEENIVKTALNAVVSPQETPLGMPEKVPIKGKRWISNQKILLTYKTQINKEIMINWFAKKHASMVFCRIAHETGDSLNPYPHSHVLLDCGTIVQSADCRFYDFPTEKEDIHPNVYAVKTRTHWNNCLRYIAKEDKDNADLIVMATGPITPEDIWKEPTLADALTRCTIKDANNVIGLWNNKPLEKVHFTITMRRWQWNFFMEITEPIYDNDDAPLRNNDGNCSEGDDSFEFPTQKFGRKIIVIYDPKGRGGKSAFIKHMVSNHPDRFATIQGLGSSRDAMEVIKNALASGWNGETLLINFVRQCAEHKFYEALETFIDGSGTSQKYSGKSISWKAKRVVVFSNFMLNPTIMTYDRLDIRKIDEKTKLLYKLSFQDAINIHKQEHSERLYPTF